VSRSFLCMTWQAGHVPPMLALAKRLARRGHEVRVLAPSWVATLASDEYEFVGGDHVPDWDGERGLLIEEQLDKVLEYLYLPGWRDAVAEELRRSPADLLVSDMLLADGARAADDLGVPVAFTSVILFQPWYDVYGHFGLQGETTAEIVDRAAVSLILLPRQLDYEGGVPPKVRYLGPIADPDPVEPFTPPWPSENDEPLVMISFSSSYQRQEVAMEAVAEAVADLPIRALLLTGRHVQVDAPPNVVVRGWLPHAAVLPQASLCITHGGMGTIQNSLSYGVPMIVMPHLLEQAMNGQRVFEIGAGKMVPAEAAADDIRAAVTEVLGDPSYRAAARHASTWFRDGGDRAVEILEGVAAGA